MGTSEHHAEAHLSLMYCPGNLTISRSELASPEQSLLTISPHLRQLYGGRSGSCDYLRQHRRPCIWPQRVFRLVHSHSLQHHYLFHAYNFHGSVYATPECMILRARGSRVQDRYRQIQVDDSGPKLAYQRPASRAYPRDSLRNSTRHGWMWWDSPILLTWIMGGSEGCCGAVPRP